MVMVGRTVTGDVKEVLVDDTGRIIIPPSASSPSTVDVASIAAGDTNIGNVDVATLPSIPAGSNNIGDVDVLTLPAIPTGSNEIGTVTTRASDPKYTKIWKYVALGATTETTLWTPSSGKKFVITDIIMSGTATSVVTLRDGTAGTIFMLCRLTTSYPFIANLTTPIQSTTANNNLTGQASAITVNVTILGYEV